MDTKEIYVAGSLFSLHEGLFLEPIKSFFLPHRDAVDVGVAGRKRDMVFYDDIEYLNKSKVVIALLDGPDVDSGTAVELGYAYAKEKEIFGILTDKRYWNNKMEQVEAINNMIWGVCQEGKRIYSTIDVLADNIRNVLLRKD